MREAVRNSTSFRGNEVTAGIRFLCGTQCHAMRRIARVRIATTSLRTGLAMTWVFGGAEGKSGGGGRPMTAPTKCVDRICRGVQGTPAGDQWSPLRVLLVAAYGSRGDHNCPLSTVHCQLLFHGEEFALVEVEGNEDEEPGHEPGHRLDVEHDLHPHEGEAQLGHDHTADGLGNAGHQ